MLTCSIFSNPLLNCCLPLALFLVKVWIPELPYSLLRTIPVFPNPLFIPTCSTNKYTLLLICQFCSFWVPACSCGHLVSSSVSQKTSVVPINPTLYTVAAGLGWSAQGAQPVWFRNSWGLDSPPQTKKKALCILHSGVHRAPRNEPLPFTHHAHSLLTTTKDSEFNESHHAEPEARPLTALCVMASSLKPVSQALLAPPARGCSLDHLPTSTLNLAGVCT